MPNQTRVRQEITDRIVKDIVARGGAPWRGEWPGGLPTNVATGRHYRGINTILLHCQALDRGWRSPHWGTARQWADRGGKIRPYTPGVPAADWGCLVVFFQPVHGVRLNARGEEVEVDFPLLKTYTVYNADQVEGATAPSLRGTVRGGVRHPATGAVGRAGAVVDGTGAEIVYGGSQASYHVTEDVIHCPPVSHFRSRASFFGTLFHELTHWTGHPSRLARLPRRGEDAYAFEELVAELGGVFLVAETGLPLTELEDHTNYLDDWLKMLGSDTRAIFRAAGAASAAVDYVLGAGDRAGAGKRHSGAATPVG